VISLRVITLDHSSDYMKEVRRLHKIRVFLPEAYAQTDRIRHVQTWEGAALFFLSLKLHYGEYYAFP
jgi:hypothetical protein